MLETDRSIAELRPDANPSIEGVDEFVLVYSQRYSKPTVSEYAEALGIESYDTAVPIDWMREMIDNGDDPRGHFVWSYDDSALGVPRPVTAAGYRMLQRYDERHGSSFAEEVDSVITTWIDKSQPYN